MSRIRKENAVDVTVQALEDFLQGQVGLAASAILIGCEWNPEHGCVRFYVAGPEQDVTDEGAVPVRFPMVVGGDVLEDIMPAWQPYGAPRLDVTPQWTYRGAGDAVHAVAAPTVIPAGAA